MSDKISNIKIISYTANKDDSLPHFIKLMRKRNRTTPEVEYYDSGFLNKLTPLDDDISNEELAEVRLNTTWEMLRKRLNQTKDLSRDYLIAICSQVQLGSYLTNYALKLAGLPLLSAESDGFTNPRDMMIINILDDCSKEYMTIPEINNALEAIEKPLKLYNPFPESLEKLFTIESVEIKVDYDYAKFNPLDSLSTMYDINQYDISATCNIKISNTDDTLSISMYKDSSLRIIKNGDYQHIENYRYEKFNIPHYKNVINSLKNNIKNKQKEIFYQLNDTKNYSSRSSARYKKIGIQVFAEAFNFTIPERNEYLFVEYFNNQFLFYISNKSQFMRYQDEDEYKKFIKNYNPSIKHKFVSIEEMKKYFIDHSSSVASSYYDKKLISIFESLYNEVLNLLLQIKQNDIYIRNPNIYEDPNRDYEMCRYFGLENQFEFVSGAEKLLGYPEEIFQNQKSFFIIEFLNSKVRIDLDDVYNAFIYGLNTVEDICQIKFKYGSFQNWIENL